MSIPGVYLCFLVAIYLLRTTDLANIHIKIGVIITDDIPYFENLIIPLVDAFKNSSDNSSPSQHNTVFAFDIIDLRETVNEGYTLEDKFLEAAEGDIDFFVGPKLIEMVNLPKPYFIIQQGQTLENDGTDRLLSVIPRINLGVFDLLQGSEFVLLTTSAEELNEFIEAINKYEKDSPNRFKFHSVILDLNDAIAIKQIYYLRWLETENIVIYSRKANVTKFLGYATKVDAVNALYRWIILSFAELNTEIEKALILEYRFRSNQLNIYISDMVDRNALQKYGLELPPREYRVEYLAFFDTLMLISKIGKVFAEQAGVRQFDDWKIKMSPDLVKSSIFEVEVPGTTGTFLYKFWFGSEGLKGFRTKFTVKVYRMMTFIGETTLTDGPPILVYPPKEPDLDLSEMILYNYGKINVGIKVEPPFVIERNCLKNTSSFDNVCYSGIVIDLLEKYGAIFKVKYIYLKYDKFGDYSSEAGWSGLAGALLKQEVDIIAGGFASDEVRSHIMSFTDTFEPASIVLLVRKQRKYMTAWQFLKPFTWDLWLVIFVIFLVISLLLTLLTWIDYTTDTVSLADSLYFSMAIMTSGGSETNPRAIPSRIMVAVFMFFGITLSAAYTANMTAFLRLRSNKTVSGVDDLITGGGIKFGVIHNTDTAKLLRTAKKFPESLLWTTINRHNESLLPDLATAVDRIVNDSFVLITDSVTGMYACALNCDLLMIEQKQVYGFRFSLGLPLGTLLKKAYNSAITTVRQNGTANKIKQRYLRRPRTMCGDSDSDETEKSSKTTSLSLFEMAGVFYTLLMGVGISLFVAVLTLLWQMRNDRQERQTTTSHRQ